MMGRVWTLTAAVSLAMTAALGATLTVGADFRQVVAESTLIVRENVDRPARPLRRSRRSRRRRWRPSRSMRPSKARRTSSFPSASRAATSAALPRHGGRCAPHFVTGEVAEFFLKTGRDNALRPVGLALGVYPVALDPLTGQTAISPPLAVGLTAAAGPVVHGDPKSRQLH